MFKVLEDARSDEKAADRGSKKEEAAAEESPAEKMLGGDTSGDMFEDKVKDAGGGGEGSNGKGIATVKVTYDEASSAVGESLPDSKGGMWRGEGVCR